MKTQIKEKLQQKNEQQGRHKMVNKCIFVGHLGADPEVRYTQGGDAVATFSIACSEKWKDKEGNPQESTEWVRCVAWRRLGEVCGEYLKKGSLVYVEGKMQTRKWQDKDGKDNYTTEINLFVMKMLGGRPNQGNDPVSEGRRERVDKNGGNPDHSMGEDVPF